jgi:TPR repeat protein
VAEDQARATAWYGRAALAGNITAQYLYAVQLEFGWGAKVDLEAAMSWYRKAAAGGSADAKMRLTKESP